jgi:hypothetical protein
MNYVRIFLCVFSVASQVQIAHAQLSPIQMQTCSSATSLDERKRCEQELVRALKQTSQSSDLGHGWTEVRSKNIRGEENLAVMHASDDSRSDPDFAGLNFRCGPKGLEMTLILLSTLGQERRESIPVHVSWASGQDQFEATAINGGYMILLPSQVSELAARDWGHATEVSFEVGASGQLRGVVSITGLSAALNALRSACLLVKP